MLRPTTRFAVLLCIATLFCIYTPLFGQGTKLWNQSRYDEFEKGQPQNIAIASYGHLEPGPALNQLASTPSTYIWSVAADKSGAVYAATGSPATVLRIAPNGTTTKVFETKDLNVQVVRVGPDGALYVATLPGGKVYRVPRQATNLDAEKAQVIFDPKTAAGADLKIAASVEAAKVDAGPQYIWDMTFDAQGRLYIATGGPAAIYRVATTGNAKPELFFNSDEQHIRSLLFLRDGTLIAGSDGDGLVYKFEAKGSSGPSSKAFVLYNAPKREITGLAESPTGTLYIAAVGEKGKSNLPPLPVTGAQSITITIVAPGSVQASNTNSLIPEGSDVYEITREGAPRKLWTAKDDVIYALHSTPEGLLATTGNRGRVYRIGEDGQFADVAHLQSGQVTSIADAPNGSFVLGTSNSGKVYQLGIKPSAESTFLSDSFDAGAFARWGRAEVDAGSAGQSGSNYDLFARSGNVSSPERDWSAWTKVSPTAATLGVPAARFAQWKLVLRAGARVNAVGLNYLPVNVAPVVDEVVVQPGARVNQQALAQPAQQSTTINLPSVSANVVNIVQDQTTGPLQAFKDKTAVTARWAAHDENGDDLTFAVYFRSTGGGNWQLLKDDLNDRFLSFDQAQLPDGAYQLKVVASDAPSHTPGDAMTGSRESDRFTVDTTTPAVGPLTARLENGKLHVVADAKDSASPITHAEYSIDAGPWQYIEPVGKLSDSLSAHYDFSAPLPQHPERTTTSLPAVNANEHVVTLRVYDRYDNSASAKAVVR